MALVSDSSLYIKSIRVYVCFCVRAALAAFARICGGSYDVTHYAVTCIHLLLIFANHYLSLTVYIKASYRR